MTNRKLQAEIEKVLKKVSEGVEVFESIFDKIQTATNSTQKEKYEQDLKKEIKKLQRFRDQIKSWQTSNEVKDKRPLNDNRRLIELQMEKFKACEKELKTKAFSKEGLNAATKVDPMEKEKEELCTWITDTVEQISLQVEKFEAEQESLEIAIRKTKKPDSSKTSRLTAVLYQIERHKFHMGKLEIILRMLENGNLTFDDVRGIQDDVNFYVESNQDTDFAEDEGIYDDLSLEEAEVYGFSNEDEEVSELGSGEIPASPARKDSTEMRKDGLEFTPKTDAVIPTEVKKSEELLRKKSIKEPKEKEEENLSPSKVKSVVKKDEIIKEKEPVANAAAKFAKPGIIPKIAPLPPKPGTSAILKTSPIEAPGPLPQRYASAVLSSQISTTSPSSSLASTVPIQGTLDALPSETEDIIQTSSEIPQITSHPITSTVDENIIQLSKPEKITDSLEHYNIKKLMEESIFSIDEMKTSILSDLVPSFESIKGKTHSNERNYNQQMLDISLQYHPDAADSERPFSYMPNMPYPTPGYYPQVPYALFEKNPQIFEKFDIDTLFFIFYYQQGTYQQYMAARQLKSQSWRFHKKYLTWFQRHEEPKTITDEYEQGTYIYFDYEGAWCRRKKADFKFEYRFLEDV